MPTDPAPSVTQDQKIVRLQLWLGFGLIVIGGLIGAVCGVIFSDRDLNGVGLAMGSAVIGAGAVLLPGGAAGSASARILAGLPDVSSDPSAASVKTLDPDPGQLKVASVARLRGTVTSPAGATAWFEWGDSQDELSKRTPEQKIASGVDVPVTGDASGDDVRLADRYYRLVAGLPSGTEITGSIETLPKVG